MAQQFTDTLIQPAEIVNSGILKATPLNQRFDESLLSPHIYDGELAFVIPVLGRTFYESLKTAKGTTVSNYNSDIGPTAVAFSSSAVRESLWTKHLLPFCALAAYHAALPFIAVRSGANGLFFQDHERGENVGVKGVQFLQERVQQKLQNRKDSLLRYLCENKDEADLADFDSSCCEKYYPTEEDDCCDSFPGAPTGTRKVRMDETLNVIFYNRKK